MSLRALYLSGAPRLSTHDSTESLGPRSHILGVLFAFRRAGIEVDELIVGDRSPAVFTQQGAEARLSKSWLTVLATDVLRLVYRFRNQLLARRMLSAGPYDFVYERYSLFQSLGSVRRKPIEWILEVNALLAIEATSERRATTSRAIAKWVEGRTFRKADRIIAVTDSLRSQIVSVYGVDPARIDVIANGVDVQPGQRRAPESLKRIGFLGALYEWQNLDALIRALALPGLRDLILDIAGDGSQRSRLERLAHELGVDDRVVFHGRVHPDRVQEFLSTVDLCYAGHDSSNGAYFSPLKLWEYLAAGRPIVASMHQVTTELAQEGFAVITFEGRSADHVGAVLLQIKDDYASLSRVAAESVDRVRESFSWDARIAPLVHSITAKHHGG